ncbi:DNA alkylation repair protein [Arthrobacter sp. MSA 4-2]|uniref:DNA alkylation repair protein n=1 Tax=Arthrobacter sp. MSA 4-2 TaxID=2794349 RepID=UPI0018E81401|nr:DNA alkylation repair protein [Arthrobacter sp. MSA 4-2]MBJ2121336.1 DNA alkylation repair protein [Arthrobacter sp. MSA 4-2]
MSAAAEFIDDSLQYESTEERAEDYARRLGDALEFYGASVGAIRGTIRNASRRYPELQHDAVTALASELWARPVFERRLGAVVLLQANLKLLHVSDLTRVEGFLRSSVVRDLADPLAVDVVGALLLRLDGQDAVRARAVLERWASSENIWLRRAAVLVHLPAFRKGEGDEAVFRRTVRLVTRAKDGRVEEVEEAIRLLRGAMES